ncbi:MAG TPA: FkbM family methyltransferase [Myxococcota bacterium]
MRGRHRLTHFATPWLATKQPLRVTSFGLRFELDLGEYVEEQIFWEDYERNILTWWPDEMGPGRVFLDVGANVGLYSLAAAARGATVVAFEPNPRTRARLHANIRLNALEDRITVRPEALIDSVGTATLFADVHEGQKDANAGVASLSSKNAAGRSIEVKTSTLDAIVEELGLARVDWIKMDIQGAEYQALKGGSRTLAGKPKLLLELEPEIARNMGWTVEELQHFLRERGYSMRALDSLNVVAEPSP